MNFALFVFRGVLLVIIILLLMMHFVPSVDTWCSERIESMKDSYGTLSNYIKDEEYNIPEMYLRPDKRMLEFYRNHEEEVLSQMINTRKEYKNQHFVGSVLTDGFHASLPQNSKWVNGMVVIGGEDIRKEGESLRGEVQH